MITCVSTLEVKEGQIERVAEILKEIIPKIKKTEPGMVECIPHSVKGETNKNTIVLIVKFKDEKSHNFHYENFENSFEEVMPFLKPGMDLKSCHELI